MSASVDVANMIAPVCAVPPPFCVRDSRPEFVSAPDTFVSPAPRRLLNDCPLIRRFVVEAVVNDAYVVEE